MKNQTMITSHITSLLLTGLIGCSGAPTWGTCSDAECRAKAIEAEFDKDPNRVLQDLRTMQDPIEQLSLVEQLAHAYPEQKNDICGVTSPGSPAFVRCERLELRPHLYTGAQLQTSKDRLHNRQAPGPAESVPMGADLPPPWDASKLDEDAVRGDCGANSTCLSDKARAYADSGKGSEAGAACAVAWPEGTSARDECMFRAAESLATAGGMSVIKESLALCSAAGSITRNCTQHVLIESFPDPPPADAPDAKSVEEAIAGAKFFQDNWPEPQKTFYPSFFWAVWTRDAFAKADSITGHLLTALPPEAAPHVRAAAAWKYAKTAPDAFQDLDRVAGYLKGRLAITGPLAAVSSRTLDNGPRIEAAQPGAFWTTDKNDLERQIPSVIFIGSGRRATSPNPDDDLRIAVIEAGARMSPPPSLNFMASVIQSKHSDLVRWTAARLLASLFGPAVRQNGLSDPNPLVQDGLDYSRTGSTSNSD